MTVLLVALGAAVGAPLRYVTDQFVQAKAPAVVLPWGTLIVNVIGSFLLGMMAAASARGGLSDDALALGGIGFCGALSTYSTFSYDTVRLLEDGNPSAGLVNIVVNLAGGLAAATAGWWLV